MLNRKKIIFAVIIGTLIGLWAGNDTLLAQYVTSTLPPPPPPPDTRPSAQQQKTPQLDLQYNVKHTVPQNYDDVQRISTTIVDMMNTEAMLNVRVSYGAIVDELKDLSKSFKEAKMALEVGRIFYAEKRVNAYNTLGIGRLIYQLPESLCKIFIDEIFGGKEVPDDLDEETLNTISKFFENNLNVSETSRQLFVHRNTLVYRIEKLEKSSGLDVRNFDDALTFKIALMVISYMKYLEGRK